MAVCPRGRGTSGRHTIAAPCGSVLLYARASWCCFVRAVVLAAAESFGTESFSDGCCSGKQAGKFLENSPTIIRTFRAATISRITSVIRLSIQQVTSSPVFSVNLLARRLGFRRSISALLTDGVILLITIPNGIYPERPHACLSKRGDQKLANARLMVDCEMNRRFHMNQCVTNGRIATLLALAFSCFFLRAGFCG